jgi:hypothetical protein
VLLRLKHNEESSAPAEKPAGTIINAPIEVKKGPTIEENPCGKDTQRVTKSGVILCYTSITTYYRPVLHGEKLEIKKPTIPHNADLAYETGAKKAIQELAANPGRNVFTTEDIQKACAVVGFAGDEHCKAGYLDTVRNIVLKQPGPGVKPEGPVVCKGPAGTANGLSTTQPETGCRHRSLVSPHGVTGIFGNTINSKMPHRNNPSHMVWNNRAINLFSC